MLTDPLSHSIPHVYSGTGSTIDKSNVNKLNISWLYRLCVTNKWRLKGMSTVCSGMHQCSSCSREEKNEKVNRKQQENHLRLNNSWNGSTGPSNVSFFQAKPPDPGDPPVLWTTVSFSPSPLFEFHIWLDGVCKLLQIISGRRTGVCTALNCWPT